MTVDYFYTRAANYTIRAAARSTDGGIAEASIIGTGTHYYGENVAMKATVASGYSFEGWYKAADVLNGYTDSSGAQELSQYSLKTDISGAVPVSGTTDFTVTVTGNTDYVALLKPEDVSDATVSVNGKNSYSYGYASSTGNYLKATVTLPAGASTATYVSGYQWYEISVNSSRTAIAGATSSTYLFPTGKEAGTYTYECAIGLSRKDNARSRTISSNSYAVTVTPADIEVEVKNYSGTYDGKYHGIGVTVKKPASGYEIYYSKTSMSSGNYETAGSKQPLSYDSVSVNNGVRTYYTVYYYIHSTDRNFKDFGSFGTVRIDPVYLDITSGTAAYSKIYDGDADVKGSVTVSGDGKYILAHKPNLYIITGFVSGTGDSSSSLLDFSASFNSAHVKDANAVTLRDMKIVLFNGETNYNYIFTSSTILNLSGYIEPLPLKVTWDADTDFIYDGKEHKPEISLVSGQTVPDDVKLASSGAQTNVGNYTAIATVVDSASYNTSDYTFDILTRNFKITKRSVTIAPREKSCIYDGTVRYIVSFNTTGLADGHTYTAGTTGSGRAAGTYTVSACNMRIYDKNSKAANDNYSITYGSASLTINKRTVSVNNIRAENKTYDGNTSAVLDLSGIIFDGIIKGDSLALSTGSVTGSFETAGAGNGKNVAISIAEGALTGSSAADYSLDRNESQKTATADITKGTITVTPFSSAVTYGEGTDFSVTYSGAAGADTDRLASIITGTVKYKVGKTEESAADYSKTLGAGSYSIYIDVSSLSANDYIIKAASAPAVLTVKKRPLNVNSSASPSVNKVYDGTTAGTAYVKRTDYEFGSVLGTVSSGVVNSDLLKLSRFTAAYDNKDVKTAAKVTMTDLSVDNANYELKTASFEIKAGITAKPLTVTADEKSVTYGDASPAFSASINGLVNGDTAGTLNYTCSYDSTNAAYRHAGSYTISPDGFKNADYAVTYVPASLTVKKAVISVRAYDKIMNYGKASEMPSNSVSYSGFKYSDTESVISNVNGVTWSYSPAADIKSVAGEYAIIPAVNMLGADNYTFSPVNGKLTVKKISISVNGVTAADKIYDGKKEAAVSTDKVTYTLDDGTALSGNDLENAGVTATGIFADADAANGKNVTLTLSLNAYLNERFYLDSNGSQKTAAASVKKAPLQISANNMSVKYGEPVPVYKVTYKGFVNGETDSVLSGTLHYECPYSMGSAVGSYTVTPSGFTGKNYEIMYQPGTLTVTKATLAKPAPDPVWNASTPGTVSWNEVAGIGNVKVKEYKIALYKDGNASPIISENKAAGSGVMTRDFASEIRANGAGAYIVKINAVAENGGDNVADGPEGSTASLYAANVTPVFASDDATVSANGGYISVNSSASYVMIAGEKAIPLRAAVKNATGYTYKVWSSSSPALTISDLKKSPSETAVTASASLSSTLASAAGISLSLSLEAVPATLKAKYTVNTVSAPYLYSSTQAPKVTVTPEPDTGDNVTASGYDYAYQWQYRPAGGGWTDIQGVSGGNLSSCSLPVGLIQQTYNMRCIVTAVRRDNGLKKEITFSSCEVKITRAVYAPAVELKGWTYGEARNTPSVTQNPETGKVTYKYSTSSGNSAVWSDSMPADAGTYYIRATVAQTNNYAEVTTSPVQFSISKTKLATPSNIKTVSSGSASYGMATWDASAGPQENNGSSPKSIVTVSYNVKLQYQAPNTTGWTDVKTYMVNGCTVDMTAEMTGTGVYGFTVQAIANVSNGMKNCDDSDTSERMSTGNIISAEVSADNCNKTYDGSPLKLSISGYTGSGTITSYQWLRNGKEIAGATESTYDVTYAEQSGSYTCNFTASGSGLLYSTIKAVTVSSRAASVSSATLTKVYDGTPLSGNSFTPSDLAAGDSMTLTLGHSVTNVGTIENTITAVSINRGTKTVYAENGGTANNYKVEKRPGKLTVAAKSLGNGAEYTGGIIVSQPAAVTYDGSTHTPGITVSDSSLKTGVKAELVQGTDYTVSYSNNTAAGTAVITITGKGNYTGSITRSFTINKRRITISSDSASKTYDGTALTKGGTASLSYNSDINAADSMAAGDSISSVNFTGTQTDAGSSKNTYDNLVIKNSSGSVVTDSYTVVSGYGTLAVTQAKDAITITGDISKTYDGKEVNDPAYTRKGTGNVELSYYTKSGSTYNKLSVKPKDAGTYYVSINEAAAGNYAESVSAYREFIISKVVIKLEAEAASSIYYEPLAELKYKETGTAVTGEDLGIKISTNATAASPAGSNYDITITYNTAMTNYAVTVTNAKYTVINAAMKVNAADVNVTYDGKAHSISVNNDIAGAAVYYGATALNAENYNTSGNTANPGYTEAGSYTVFYFVMKPNYTAVSGSAKITVSKAGQTVHVGGITAEYDGTAHAASAEATGKTTGAATGSSITYEYYKGSVTAGNKLTGAPVYAGIYTVKATAGETGDYNSASAEAEITVTARPITISAGSATKVYDGNSLTESSYTVTGGSLAEGDIIESVKLTGSQTDAGTCDNAASELSVKHGSENAENSYSVTYKKGTLIVTQANGSISISGDLSKDYDREIVHDPVCIKSGDYSLKYTYFRVSDNGTRTELAAKPVNAGKYAVVVSAQATNNYKVPENAEQIFSIRTREITIKAVDASSSYGKDISNLSVSVISGNICEGDDLKISAVTNARKSSPAGTYIISPNYVPDSNYRVTAINGTYTVLDADAQYNVTGYAGKYDEAPHSISVNALMPGAVIYYGTEQLNDANFSTEGKTAAISYTDAGTYKVYYYIKSDNYRSVSGNAEVTIGKADAVMTAENVTAVYDGQIHKITAFATGDGIVSYQNNDNTEPGTYTVTAAAATNNYNQVQKTATVTIKKRSIIFTAGSKSKTYDGSSLTYDHYDITGDGLASGHFVKSISVDGSVTQAGVSVNRISSAVIIVSVNGTEKDVTGTYYTVEYRNGNLTVIPVQAGGGSSSGDSGKEDGEAASSGSSDTSADGTLINSGISETENITGTGNDTSGRQQAADEKNDAEQQNEEAVSENGGGAEKTDESEKSSTDGGSGILQQETVKYGNGNIIVTVESSDDDTKIDGVKVVDVKKVIDSCLTAEEKDKVNKGSTIEIRLKVTKKPDKDVTENEKDEIAAEQKKDAAKIDGLTFGQYIDIELDKRIDGGKWNNIPEASEDIEILIDIPDELQFKGSVYYIIRDHEGKCRLLFNLIDSYTQIKISTKYFSTYAILYTKADQPEKAVCIMHIFIPVLLLIYFIVLCMLRKKKKQSRYAAEAAACTGYIILAVCGSCACDWPFAIAAAVITVIAEPVSQKIFKENSECSD